MRDFTKYGIWREAISLSVDIYKLTRRFPSEEKYGLTSQIRRASVSISSNIAEGCSRSSEKEFSRFIEISIGSLFEVKSQLFLAVELEFLDKNVFDSLNVNIDKLGKQLNSLRNKLKN